MVAAYQLSLSLPAEQRSNTSPTTVVPQMACDVVDRAIQVHGGMGVCDDVPLAAMYAGLRTLRIADGPDEVHLRSVARVELGRYLTRSH